MSINPVNIKKSPITAIRVTFSFDELDALVDCLHTQPNKDFYTTKAYIKLVGLQRKQEVMSEPKVRETLDLDTPLHVKRGANIIYQGLTEAESLEYVALFNKLAIGEELSETENNRLNELFFKQS